MLVRIIIFASLIALFTFSCGSTPYQPVNIETQMDEFVITTESSGLVGFFGKLKKKVTCDQLSVGKIDLEIYNKKTVKKIKLIKDCKSFKNSVWIRSADFIPSGKYHFEFSRSDSLRFLDGNPQPRVRFKNPDFRSGSDQVVTGSMGISGNQTLTESVSYNQGDRTDWFLLEGNEGRISVAFQAIDTKNPSTAHIYKRKKGRKRLRRVLRLKPGHPRTLILKSESDLFVRVRAAAYKAQSKYVLRRRILKKKPKKKVRTIPIVDCFPVDSKSSTALIQNSEGLKVGDSIQVLGAKNGQGFQKVGDCQVSSISSGQATCQMNMVVKAEFSHFKGEVL